MKSFTVTNTAMAVEAFADIVGIVIDQAAHGLIEEIVQDFGPEQVVCIDQTDDGEGTIVTTITLIVPAGKTAAIAQLVRAGKSVGFSYSVAKDTSSGDDSAVVSMVKAVKAAESIEEEAVAASVSVKSSMLKRVGFGLLGAAAIGAVGYLAYKRFGNRSAE